MFIYIYVYIYRRQANSNQDAVDADYRMCSLIECVLLQAASQQQSRRCRRRLRTYTRARWWQTRRATPVIRYAFWKVLSTVFLHCGCPKALTVENVCNKPRKSMPEFLKRHFMRQYGFKSIALTNLANLAAGVCLCLCLCLSI